MPGWEMTLKGPAILSMSSLKGHMMWKYIGLRAQGKFWHSNVMLASIVMLILLHDDNKLLECLMKSIQVG